MESAPASPVPPVTPVRLASLDALRGLSALIVFLTHWHVWSNFPPHGAFETGVHAAFEWLYTTFTFLCWPTGGHHPAVISFFVISGFCIHYPFERRARLGAPAPHWRDYFLRRFKRIMPVYWAACAIGFLLVAVERAHPSGSPLLQLHTSISTYDVVMRVAALTGLSPGEIYAGNYILITVTVEMVFYVIYPAFFHFAQRGKWLALGVFFVGVQISSLALLSVAPPFWVFNSPLMFGLFFYAGALIAHLYLRGARLQPGWLLASWALFLVLKVTPHFYGLNVIKQAVWSVVCALGIWLAVGRETDRTPPATGRSVSVLRWLGEISYSLYATHTPAIMLGTWAIAVAGLGNYSAQLAATLAFTVIATLAVHYGIERRFYQTHSIAPSSLEERLPGRQPDAAAARVQQ